MVPAVPHAPLQDEAGCGSSPVQSALRRRGRAFGRGAHMLSPGVRNYPAPGAWSCRAGNPQLRRWTSDRCWSANATPPRPRRPQTLSSATPANSTKQMSWAKTPAMRWATSIARRVLPTPPGPANVTSLTVRRDSRSTSRADSCWRPKKRVRTGGRAVVR